MGPVMPLIVPTDHLQQFFLQSVVSLDYVWLPQMAPPPFTVPWIVSHAKAIQVIPGEYHGLKYSSI